jgi:hypothetical protein
MRYLIQRLEKPSKDAKWNPFSFGGGYRNGGLSADAVGLLAPVFQPAYMGAAEYEFGALPKALQAVATLKKGVIKTIPSPVPLWVYCSEPDWDALKQDIKHFSDRSCRLTRDYTGLDSRPGGLDRTIGGLAVPFTSGDYTPFVYFTSKEALDKMLAVLGVSV